MSITSPAPVQCAVHLAHQHFYPGDAVEGAVVIDTASALDVSNIHVKIVGKEEVSALVDQVNDSKIRNLQFGISYQDYVYYREIVTLAGSLITHKLPKKLRKTGLRKAELVNPNPASSTSSNVPQGEESDESDEPIDDAEEVSNDDDDATTVRYNESICICPGAALQNRSRSISRLATAEGVCVQFPAGHYVYPFRFLLPSVGLPPNYDTGVCVKDRQYSNSQAALQYYMKVYVWSPRKTEIASARADFIVGSIQPIMKGSNNLSESRGVRNGSVGGHNAAAAPPSTSPFGDNSNNSNGSRAKVPATSSAKQKTARCVFPVMGTCAFCATGAKLRVTFTLAAEPIQIDRDAIRVTCAIASNTSAKAIRGVKVSLIQVLRFETDVALVRMRKTIVDKEVLQAVAPGKKGEIIAETPLLESREDLMPTMQTSGLDVTYLVRVELLASHVGQAYYEFENVQLAGAMLAGAMPPVGRMHFTALPHGRLSQSEAYYAIPANPTEEPILAHLEAPVTCPCSRGVSRRPSRLATAGSPST